MNSSYHPPDMSQRMPGPGYSSSVPPPIHAYQQQQQHQHPPPSLLPPPPTQHHHSSHAPPPPPPPSSSSHSLSSHQHHAPPPPHHHSQLPPYPPTQYQQPHPNQYPRPHPLPPSRNDEPPPPSSEPSPSDQHEKPKYEPPSVSKIEEGTGLKYSLDVQQQPIRARMCGFGDKDRRPITPPPCVRLVIINSETGKEVDYNTLDHAMFVLSVDLWDKDGIKEVNLVRSSTGPGSGASSNNYSYSTLEPSTPSYQQQALPPSRESGYPQGQGLGYAQEYPPSVQQGYGQAPSYQSSSSYGPPQQYFPRHSGYNTDPPASSANPLFRNGYGQDQNALTRMAVVGTQPQGMFTRNLIGSLAASAFRLNDTDKKAGIWFVLQDLSVRTEGTFRLRFSFVNVGGAGGGLPIHVNQGRAPILASCYSQDFSVYSAKKFPGVCESTPLSKTFALQGIKIPIRKDTNIKGEGDEEMMYDQN
ncbi:hypothetical protein SNK03_001559 [Fusarium graminearum]|uniref:Velvet complex subunit B n=4 Tax=Gibberella zeae TaxID=5518 RepID=VELB_GIBZE|nr:hypothetical protein FG05_01362 [Fusarium graminearum]KAI6759147.1 hypothetical protein HG531_013908 [Fusarium graminearum]PCD22827.1 hypothetical protein FGRA07_04197 [Fusarium graminearum]CAF3575064.1 unnamed protein product [Fusarium graminearum]CAF3595656.1 unnamed protein product [Fusarium graminearum]